jgi:hypothetical protein
MEVGCQHDTPGALPPGNNSGINLTLSLLGI